MEAPTDTKAPALFDVVPARPIEDLPKPQAPYYVVDGKSYLVHRQTRFGRVLARLTQRPETILTYEQNGYFWKDIPKIPAELLAEIRALFAHVFEKHKAEAMVLLTVHDDTGEWDYIVPSQTVSHTSVDYDYAATSIPVGQSIVGTIHSHCDFSAFHSGTDETDAAKHDGIHMTMGHVDSDKFEIAAMVAFNSMSWTIEPADYMTLDPSNPKTFDALLPLSPIDARPHYFDSFLELIQPHQPKPTSNALSKWVDAIDDEGWWDYGRKPKTDLPATTWTSNYTPSSMPTRDGPAWPGYRDVSDYARTNLGRTGYGYPQPYDFSADDRIMLNQVERDLSQLEHMLRFRGYEFDAAVLVGPEAYVVIGDPVAKRWYDYDEDCGCEHQCGR